MRFDFALANDRSRKYRLAGFALGGQRFACQRGLIHFHRVARQQARIGRHNVAQAQADDVARHHFTRRRVGPFPIAFHLGFDGQLGLLSAAMALPAWCSSQNPTTALDNSSSRMMKKSGQCRTTPDRITAPSIIHGMGPQK